MSRHVPSLSVSPGVWRTSHLASPRSPPAILVVTSHGSSTRCLTARNIQKPEIVGTCRNKSKSQTGLAHCPEPCLLATLALSPLPIVEAWASQVRVF